MSLNLWHLAFLRSNIDFIKTYTYSIGGLSVMENVQYSYDIQMCVIWTESDWCRSLPWGSKRQARAWKIFFGLRISGREKNQNTYKELSHTHTRNSFEFDLGFKITIYTQIYIYSNLTLVYWLIGVIHLTF